MNTNKHICILTHKASVKFIKKVITKMTTLSGKGGLREKIRV